MTCQGWNSEKIVLCISLLLCKKGIENTHLRSFFRPPTLTSHSFAASQAMLMKSSSFEIAKSYLYAYNLKNSKAALLRYMIPIQSTPIL